MPYDKLSALLEVIDDAVESSEHGEALRLILANWSKLPDPSPLRERVAILLASSGRKREAVELYELVARHYANAGFPARSLAAIKQMQALKPDISGLLDHFTALYNIRSPYLQRDGARPQMATPDDVILEPDSPPGDVSDMLNTAVNLAESSTGLVDRPTSLPALSLLSLLPPDTLRRVLDYLEYEIFAHGEPVLRADDRSEDLIWTVSSDFTVRDGDAHFRLPAGVLLGLNSFGQSGRPATHTVVSHRGSELVRLGKAAIEKLHAEFGDFENRIATLRRHALTEGLLQRHPLFAGLDEDAKAKVASHFLGLRVAKGETLIYEHFDSPGIFLMLDGSVDIIRHDDDWEITVASLSAGDVFGEVGLVSDSPAVASVVTTSASHLLYLGREDFNSVASQYPSVAKYTVNLANSRLEDIQSTLSAQDLAEME